MATSSQPGLRDLARPGARGSQVRGEGQQYKVVHDLFFKVELSPVKLGSQGSGIRTLQGQIQGVWLRASCGVMPASGLLMARWSGLSASGYLPTAPVTRLPLPQAVLAAAIIVNLKGMLKQFTDIPSLWKSNQMDLVRGPPSCC